MSTLIGLRRLSMLIILIAYHGSKLAVRLVINALFKNSSVQVLLGNAWHDFSQSAGAAFIKIGQIASTRPDLLPSPIIDSLSKLQDHVAPIKWRKIAPFVEREFGQPLTEIFSTFEKQPIASASVAQVHYATLLDGTEVAVKILRPGLKEKVQNDLKLLYGGVRIMGKLPQLQLIPLLALCQEFGKVLEQQLDFRLEAENNRQFRLNFKDNPGICFPDLIEEYCTESILTMDYMKSLNKVGQVRQLSERRRECLAVKGLRAFYQMIFTDGLVHGDLHSGNIFFGENDDLIILDTGFVARLDEETKTAFTEFFFGMVTRNGQKCGQIIYDSASYRSPDCDGLKFSADIADIVNRHSEKSAHEFEVTSFAAELFDSQRRFGIRGSTDFIMTIISLVVFEGIMKQIYPGLDFQDEARRFILRAKYGLMPPRSINYEQSENADAREKSVSSPPKQTAPISQAGI